MFAKVKSKKVYMEIVDQILLLIRTGKLQVGQKLPPERILSVELGVSRPPLREAISALEILGIIESRGGKGNIITSSKVASEKTKVVRDLKRQVSPFELLEARKLLEVEIAGLAAEKATQEDLDYIGRLVKEHGDVISDYSRASASDQEFHLALVKATKNAVLLDIFNSHIATGLKNGLWQKIKGESWAKGDHAQKYFSEHIGIYESLRQHDKDGARRCMQKHLQAIEEDFLEESE